MKIREGYMDFKGLKTYWRVAGESDGIKKPIIFLHGGPGSSHNYFEVLDGLAVRGNDAQNRQDSVRETVQDWLSGLGY